jgi:hypothetical protein
MVDFGSWRGLTCKSQISPVMKKYAQWRDVQRLQLRYR